MYHFAVNSTMSPAVLPNDNEKEQKNQTGASTTNKTNKTAQTQTSNSKNSINTTDNTNKTIQNNQKSEHDKTDEAKEEMQANLEQPKTGISDKGDNVKKTEILNILAKLKHKNMNKQPDKDDTQNAQANEIDNNVVNNPFLAKLSTIKAIHHFNHAEAVLSDSGIVEYIGRGKRKHILISPKMLIDDTTYQAIKDTPLATKPDVAVIAEALKQNPNVESVTIQLEGDTKLARLYIKHKDGKTRIMHYASNSTIIDVID